MMSYVVTFLAGCAGMGCIWYFWPTEKAMLQAEVDRLRAMIAHKIDPKP